MHGKDILQEPPGRSANDMGRRENSLRPVIPKIILRTKPQSLLN